MTDEALTELNREIAVMESYRDGREIEFFNYGSKQWCECMDPGWDWVHFDYRVTPAEPLIVTYEKAKGTETLFYGPPLTTQRQVDTIAFIELTPSVREKLNL